MSNLKIRRALEIAIDGISPAIETAWENVDFKPTKGTAYQKVNILFATPQNPSIAGSGSLILTRQLGFAQVSLMYPLLDGTAAIEARAELIKTTFKRGFSFTNDGQDVHILNTPEITPGNRDNDRWMVAVKIPFWADVFA